MRVSRVGTKSLELEHDVLLPDATVAATGRTVLVGWDPVTRAARELSPREREVLSA